MTSAVRTRKKLIEVALPLDAINVASAREKSIRHGHPSTLHLWWARRPLAAARAVIFAQMVDDPSAHPEQFPTPEAQEAERLRLFKIIEQLVLWENTTNEDVLNQARDEIWKSWRATCADNQNHPRAAELFNPDKLPAFHDPFAGGGALPLEAQRLGLEAYASDLNPVAVLINKAMIEIPPKFANRPPVNPAARKDKRLFAQTYRGAQGLAEDVRYYGQWMRDEAEKRIGHLYPKVEVTAEMAADRPDLKPYMGKKLTVIAWLWARTVKSPNPAFAHVDVPLVSTFMLSKKAGKEAYMQPIVEGDRYRFNVKVGKPKNTEEAMSGTKLARGANFRCLMSDAPITPSYIKAQGKAGRMGKRLIAIVVNGGRERIFLPPTQVTQPGTAHTHVSWRPEVLISGSLQYLGIKPYGMEEFSQLFTERQLALLSTLSELVEESIGKIRIDAELAGMKNDEVQGIAEGGSGAKAYAETIGIYLAFAFDKLVTTSNTVCTWQTSPTRLVAAFSRQAIPMTWDFAEANAFGDAAGDFHYPILSVTEVLPNLPKAGNGIAFQHDAKTRTNLNNTVVSTDPPYFDNVPYADLADFFYVWLRKAMKTVFPALFSTLTTPKTDELVAFSYRHNSKKEAELFFLDGMSHAMHQLSEQTHPLFPVTIYYAFKQAEDDGKDGIASTGWDTFLDAVIRAGFAISGTWPMRTELTVALKKTKSTLASSIVLACRKRPLDAPTATRREFLMTLKSELPVALSHLQRGNIAPVDLAQAAIGPGMAIYTRYAQVLDAAGKPVSVREALTLINQTLDEVLAEQEGDFDGDTRWALSWFEQFGFNDGPFGDAETLSKAKNTAINGLEQAGIIVTRQGKVRLLRPSELPADWTPANDKRLTVWETVHQLVRVLESGGESGAAVLMAQLGSRADTARELAYHLYTVCERRKRAQEALAYNSLVQSWPEIARLAREGGASGAAEQPTLL